MSNFHENWGTVPEQLLTREHVFPNEESYELLPITIMLIVLLPTIAWHKWATFSNHTTSRTRVDPEFSCHVSSSTLKRQACVQPSDMLHIISSHGLSTAGWRPPHAISLMLAMPQSISLCWPHCSVSQAHSLCLPFPSPVSSVGHYLLQWRVLSIPIYFP